ncbi:hypothetical protein [Clostridium sp. JS66]|uniref:hypothetical protein n=1 Tax=Clostridium sp. JS66 TaxID=3064705 RepID=UPI00298E4DB2|nr:hypothetical protein [Clostridium sp. JS66]WPC42833.1 hypothetical protein Q6H37_05010 [Clostridium sp. JS66]
MDEFMKQIADLINSEVEKRTEKIVMERLNGVIKSLANKLSIDDIAWATELSVAEVRKCLQEIVDIQNNILKLCRKNDELETIESYFKLGKGKSGIEID